jgi:activator of Hsp90 ATPase-like protein
MSSKSFTVTLTTDQSPHQVFKAITNVAAWWSGYYSEEIWGGTQKQNDEFTFRAGGGMHYSKQKLIEVIPDKKVVWQITESNLSFLKKTDEWTGTKVVFDITERGGKTSLTFTHEGLSPDIECFDSCAPAWSQYLQNKLLPILNKP